jgi:uracil-DNA glycosylase
VVPGEGPLPAFGMIVGEAPGKNEVELQRPFVGPSGGLLDQALHLLDIPRDEVYITNVVKEWPRTIDGKTRRPNEEEVERWKPLFLMEIEECSAGTTLLLGKTAADLFGWSPSDAETHNIFTAWHPAYLIHRKAEIGGEWWQQWLFQLNPFAVAFKRAREM